MDSYFPLRVSLLVINGERQKFNNFLLTPQQQKKTQILLVSFFLNCFFNTRNFTTVDFTGWPTSASPSGSCSGSCSSSTSSSAAPWPAPAPRRRLSRRSPASTTTTPSTNHSTGRRCTVILVLQSIEKTIKTGYSIYLFGKYSVSRNQRCKTKSNLFLKCRIFINN